MNNIFDNIPEVKIDFSKPIDTDELFAKLEQIGKDAHKKQQRRIRDIKAWWKKLTLEQAENLLSELETNPPKGLIVDDGFNTYKPPFSIIIMKKALREFIANKKKK